MIPNKVPTDSPSEKNVFESLNNSAPDDWIVFHSFKVSTHRSSGNPREIDFLILIPEYFSVICLEVKGGSYDIKDDGQWYRWGHGEPEDKSPPEQAETAMWTLKKKYRSTHFRKNSLLSIGCAVAFVHGTVEGSLPECLPEIIEESDARDPENLVERLLNYADRMCKQSVKSKLLNEENRERAQRDWKNIEQNLNRTATITSRPERIYRVDLETLSTELSDLTTDQVKGLENILLD